MATKSGSYEGAVASSKARWENEIRYDISEETAREEKERHQGRGKIFWFGGANNSLQNLGCADFFVIASSRIGLSMSAKSDFVPLADWAPTRI